VILKNSKWYAKYHGIDVKAISIKIGAIKVPISSIHEKGSSLFQEYV